MTSHKLDIICPDISNDKPILIHYGFDWFQILITIVLFSITLSSIFLIRLVNLSMLSITISAVFGIFCIRYSRIYVYQDRVEIVKKGPIKKLLDYDIIKFEKIKKVEFNEGKTDWKKFFILASMGKGSWGGADRVSVASRMKIVMNDQSEQYFNKFGNKEHFRKTIELINHIIK